MAKITTKASGTSAATTPAPVATPLPPLPLRKMENMWPTTGAAAMTIAAQGLKKFTAITAGMNPLSMSQASTTTPAFLPRTRKTLVVPTLPDPCWRTSVP